MKSISSTRVQGAYNKLYSHLREYLWEYDDAMLIAELEVESYKAFPELDKIRILLDKLEKISRRADIDDQPLYDVFAYFNKLIEDVDTVHLKLEES